MNNEEKNIIKYFDFVITDLKDISFFSINNTLIDNKRLKIDTKEQKDFMFGVSDSVKSFGLAYKYFEKNGDNGWFKLTKKGIELKEYGKGHKKFLKKSKSQPLTKYQKIYLFFFILFGLFGVYKIFAPDLFKSDSQPSNLQQDSINIEQILSKKETTNDSLQSKNQNDLKTD